MVDLEKIIVNCCSHPWCWIDNVIADYFP